MADTTLLRQAIRDFAYQCSTSSSNGSDAVTVHDFDNLVEKLTTVLNQIADTMDEKD